MLSQAGCMSQTLTPGSSCSVQVWLAPSTTGQRTCRRFTPLIGDANTVGSADLTGDVNNQQATLSYPNVIDFDYVDFNGGMVSKTGPIADVVDAD